MAALVSLIVSHFATVPVTRAPRMRAEHGHHGRQAGRGGHLMAGGGEGGGGGCASPPGEGGAGLFFFFPRPGPPRPGVTTTHTPLKKTPAAFFWVVTRGAPGPWPPFEL